MRIRKPLLLACTSMLALPSMAFAQDGAVAPQSADTEAATTLEDIVVTATRRRVDLQEVPAVITAVSASTLKAFKVDGVLQLPNLVPGLVVTPSGGNNIYMRGIGSASTGYNEAQNAVYIDGLYLANPALGITSFNNIERIEVLKGPQGTLYGRNVTGGLISVITREPGDTPRVDLSLGYGNYDTKTLNLYASAPLGETLGASLAVFGQKQSKGWSLNSFTGNRAQKMKEIGFQTKLLWRPGEDTKVTAMFIFDHNNRNFGYARQVAPGTLATDGTPYLGEYRYASRIDATAPLDAYIGSVKIEQDLGFANLMSLTGYQTSNQTVLFTGSQPGIGNVVAGAAAASFNITTNNFAQRNRTFTQEFQLTSHNPGSRFEWVAGAFYFHDRQRLRLDSYSLCLANGCAPGAPTSSDGRPRTESYSAYGDATYRFFEATKLTVGLRYTSEKRSLSGLLSPLQGRPNSVAAIPMPAGTVVALRPGAPYTVTIGGVPVLQPGIQTSKRFNELTYRIVLAQDLAENVHAYLSHNYGFKSGAYNANVFTNPPVDPEKLYSYEAGVKSELFDRRLRLNVAYFHYDYKDIQVRSTAPPAPPGNSLLLNIAEARFDGVDADFSLVAAPGLTINGGLEYLDAKYKDYPGASCVRPATAVLNGITVGSPVVSTCNLAGFQVTYAPKWSGTIGAAYAIETGSGTFTISANDRFSASFPMTPGNEIRQPKLHIIDASLLWTSEDKRYDINLWARNLTGKYSYAGAFAARDLAVVPGPPRTYGVTAGLHF